MSLSKVTYIVSDVEKALAFEWVADYLSGKYNLLFVLIGKNNTPLIKHLEAKRIRVVVVSDNQFPSMIKKWIRIISILKDEKPAIVHAHLWRATLLGISAAWLLRIRKRIFTRHHAMLHHREYPSGLKWDKLCTMLATGIVAISQNVKNIMVQRENAKAAKIHIVHHGFDISYFDSVDKTRVDELKKGYKLEDKKGPVVGVISRYLELKGIQYIVQAFIVIKKNFPDAFLVLANAHGDYEKEIKKCLAQLPDSSYLEITFEKDLAALYRIFDVFVHTPVDPYAEAFGQTYVEALLSGVPSVFTLSGVAPEFIREGYNALVVPFKDAAAIERSIGQLLINKELRSNLIHNGKKSTAMFSLEGMLAKLEVLYA